MRIDFFFFLRAYSRVFLSEKFMEEKRSLVNEEERDRFICVCVCVCEYTYKKV